MIYALADSHLSFSVDKPMDVFGSKWANHVERLKFNWLNTVKDDDYVLMPGDISWGINLEESAADLAFLDNLPGQKYISRGNHDYWWSTLTKLNNFCIENNFKTLHFIKHQAVVIEDQGLRVILGSTKGAALPKGKCDADVKRLYEREQIRLTMALESMTKLKNELLAKDRELYGREKSENIRMICALHYPPLLKSRMETEFTKIFDAFEIPICIYGHLHARGLLDAFEGIKKQTKYINVAADHIDMMPRLIDLN